MSELKAIVRACVNCDGQGWVCENHAYRPWDGHSARKDACGCGAGMPCPECVPEGQWPPMPEGTTIICSVDSDWKLVN